MNIKEIPIRLGILGAGSFVQRRILPILKDVPLIQVTCLHKQNLIEAKQTALQFGIPHAVSSRLELLNHPEVDAVFIATPNYSHKEDAIACAEARKPTLCEKPLAPTSQAIIEMQKKFKQNSIPLFVGHSLRFKPAVQKAKELLKNGMLGKLLHIRAYFTLSVPQDNWRCKKSYGGGVLQDIGVHLIDLIQFISGENISLIHALANPTFNQTSDESEHYVIAQGHLTNEATFSFECSMKQSLRSGFEIVGTKSRLISLESLRQTDEAGESFQFIQKNNDWIDVPLKANNVYAEELMHFAQVLKGRASSLIPSSIGLNNQQIIEAAYDSIHKKKTIVL